jgi:hypothetical protein
MWSANATNNFFNNNNNNNNNNKEVVSCVCGPYIYIYIFILYVYIVQYWEPGSIPGTKKKKKVVGLERDPLSLVSTTEELLDRKLPV